jgi:hypothetical protein
MRHIQKFRTADLETWLPKLIVDINKMQHILSLGRRSNLLENIQPAIKKHNFFHSLFMCQFCPPGSGSAPMRIPIQSTKINADSDPDPRHCFIYLANCLRLLGISVSMGCVILTSGYWVPPSDSRFLFRIWFIISNYPSDLVFILPAINLIGFYERYVVLRHPRSMRVLPSGHLQNKYDYCITIKCFTGSPSARFSIALIFMIFTP